MLKNMKFIELYKYLFIGGINTVFGYGVFAFFLFLGLHYSVAVLAATILGVAFNFQTYGKFVFKNHAQRLIIKFILVYIVIYLANILLLSLVDIFIDNLYLSGVVVILPIAYLGYILNRRFVWKKS
jgi:putative flippase GtrA